MDKQQLESRILEGIPLSRSMAFEVVALDECSIRVKGHQKENINVHGTAFAGSLYAICTLAVWGLVYSRLPDNASLVMVNGDIDYLKPVIGDIVADGYVQAEDMGRFLKELNENSKCKVRATAIVEHQGKKAVRFNASLYARVA